MTPISSSRNLLLRETRVRFPNFDDAKVQIAPLEKGGSGRKFYRIRAGTEQTIILVKYDLEQHENRLYVEIAQFLAAHHIHSPEIYFHDAAEGLIWLEDLGERDLWSQRDESWLVRRALYEAALDEIAKLHALPAAVIDPIRPQLSVEFNAALYRWEQNYFFENCLRRFFGLPEKLVNELAALPALEQTAELLGQSPRVLVHRDFQSQNIIVRKAQIYLIDFQGMRPGLAAYDLASLLHDPYVTLSEIERGELLKYYRTQRGTSPDSLGFVSNEIYRLCAMQRLMQALGAYGYLGLVRESKNFLRYVHPALGSLLPLVQKKEGLEKFADVLEDCLSHSVTADC